MVSGISNIMPLRSIQLNNVEHLSASLQEQLTLQV